MKHIARKLLAALVVVSATACGGDHMQGEEVAELSDDIQAARAEVSRHHETAMAARALPEIVADVGLYDENMGGMMDRMYATMGGMTAHCWGSGTGRMHEMMSGMDVELGSHRQSMQGATILEAARARCTDHADSMNGMLDEMQGALGGMGCMRSLRVLR